MARDARRGVPWLVMYGFREVPTLAVTRAREIALISGEDSRCVPGLLVPPHYLTLTHANRTNPYTSR